MTVKSKPSTWLMGALLVPSLVTPLSASAATRWSGLDVTPTADDGLAIVSASFDGAQVLGPTAVAYFTFNGARYELKDSDRVAGPTVTRSESLTQVSATYRVPTSAGPIEVTVYHDFSDHDPQWQDIGQYGSYARFNGPEGDYHFFWRVDVDAMGPANDRVQIYGEKVQGRELFSTPATETSVDLATNPAWFGRIQAQIMDGPGYHELTYVWLASEDPSARLFVVHNQPGENEANPRDLLNSQVLQTLLIGPVNTPDAGDDQVLWYETAARGSSGLVGPQFLIAAMSGRKGFLEMDKMQRTEFPPDSAALDGDANATLAEAFAAGGYELTNVYKDASLTFRRKSSYAELQDYLNNGKSYRSLESPTNWYSHLMIANQLSGPLGPFVLGIMHDITGYDTNGIFREGAAALYSPVIANYPCDAAKPNDCASALLWTVAHETGHAYNLHHEDWCDAPTECASGTSNFYENTAIMGYSYDISTLHWTFGEKNGNDHLFDHPTEYVRPGFGVDFISENPYVYPYNTTEEHKNAHDPIE